MSDFGRDHWSTFAYFETLCVDAPDGNGRPDFERMRCNTTTHPQFGGKLREAGMGGWKPEYGTRLRKFFQNGMTNVLYQRPDHDDWDCLDDFEEAGLLKNIGTGVNPIIKLTNYGFKIAAQLRMFKGKGGIFADFVPET
jgi:hypothetical protein